MRELSDEFVKKHTSFIFRAAYFRGVSKQDAEDAVQEAFLRYMLSNKKFKDEEHERNWLIRVTINYCKNILKSAWRRRVVPLDKEILQLETEEEYRILEDLDKLQEKYRIVVELYYFQDLSVKNISKILRISETNVRKRLSRARTQIREDYKKGELLYG